MSRYNRASLKSPPSKAGFFIVAAAMATRQNSMMPPRPRPSARLLVLDPENRVLLFRFAFDDGALAGRTYWATPGGAVETGESYEVAAVRELRVETGITSAIGGQFARKHVRFHTPSGEMVDADEQYYTVRVAAPAICRDGLSTSEARYIAEHRWWSLADLRSTSETVFPEELAAWLQTIVESERD
jgi:8-oxo-dGTP diphosphatase